MENIKSFLKSFFGYFVFPIIGTGLLQYFYFNLPETDLFKEGKWIIGGDYHYGIKIIIPFLIFIFVAVEFFVLYYPVYKILLKITEEKEKFKKRINKIIMTIIFFISIWIFKIGASFLYYLTPEAGKAQSFFPLVKQKPSVLIDLGDWFLPKTVETYPSFLYLFLLIIIYIYIFISGIKNKFWEYNVVKTSMDKESEI